MRRFETSDAEWEVLRKGLEALKATLTEGNLRLQNQVVTTVFEPSRRQLQIAEMQKNAQEIRFVEELGEKLSRMPPSRRSGV